jgi:hypothetical protein
VLSARRQQLGHDVEALDRFVESHRDRLRAAVQAELAVIESLPTLVIPAAPVAVASVVPSPVASVIPPPPAPQSIDLDEAQRPGSQPATTPVGAETLDLRHREHGADADDGPGHGGGSAPSSSTGQPSIAEAELSSAVATTARLATMEPPAPMGATSSAAPTTIARDDMARDDMARDDMARDMARDDTAPITPESARASNEPATAPIVLTEAPIVGPMHVEAEPTAATAAGDPDTSIAPGFWLPSSRLVDDDDGPPTAMLVVVDTAELQAIQDDLGSAGRDGRDLPLPADMFLDERDAYDADIDDADIDEGDDEDDLAYDAELVDDDDVDDDQDDDGTWDEIERDPVVINLDNLGHAAAGAHSEGSDRADEGLGAWRSRGRPPAWRAEDSRRDADAVDDEDYLADLREAMHASDLPGPRDDDERFDDNLEPPKYGIFRRRR